MQVVTKSGTQEFHGSGYWYGRRSEWNANTWIEQAGPKRRKPKASRDDRGYTIGGPVFIPGMFNADKRKLFFFWSQEFQTPKRSGGRTAGAGADRARAARRLLADRGQQRQPVPVHPGLHDRSAVQRRRHARVLSRTAACSGGFRRTASTSPASTRLSIYPNAEHLARERPQLHQPGADQEPPARGHDPHGLPGDRTVAGHRPLHTTRKTIGAAVRHDVGGRRQRQARYARYAVRDAGHELDDFQHRRPQQLHVARAEPGPGAQLARLHDPEPEPDAHGGGTDRRFRSSSRTRCRPTTSRTSSSTPTTRASATTPVVLQTDRGPFTNFNTTYDVVANLSKIWGPHAAKFGFYFQSSLKPQSIFASFNSQINFVDNSSNPFDTQHQLRQRRDRRLQHLHAGQQVRHPGVALQEHRVVPAGQLEGDQPADAGLRRPLLLHDTAVGHDAAGVELPARGVRSSAAAKLFGPVCIGASPCTGANRRGMDPRSSVKGRTDTGQYRRGAFHRASGARLEPLQRRVPGRPGHRGRTAGRRRLQRRHPASVSPTTSAERRDDRPRRLLRSSTIGRRATWSST